MRNSTFLKIGAFALGLFFTVKGVNAQVMPDSVEMGAGYENDVYYNIETGATTEVNRTNWDIAFATGLFQSNIIINDGAGVELYAYPTADTLFWDAVDTTGLSTWKALYNDETDWDNGAFSRNALGHPDYGWGVYDDVSHNVVGDSLFIIKTKDDTWKKLWIKELVSVAVTYNFVYANLDGSDEQTVELIAADYSDKYYVYYDITNNETIDREPVKTDWDFLFTKWHAESENYNVSGVLQNQTVSIAELLEESVSGDTCYSDYEYSNARNVIGSDWKVFSMTTFSYDMVENLNYLVKTSDDVITNVNFTAFDYNFAHFNFNKDIWSPAAPTSPVIDDMANTFGWTVVEGYDNADMYEYFVKGDTMWHTCDANPQVIPAGDYAAGEVMVRIKADETTCTPAGFSLANDVAFTGVFNLVNSSVEFNVYPNPATDVLNIVVNDSYENTSVELFNLVGEIVYKSEFTNNGNLSISVDELANGTYMLKVNSGNQTGSRLIVVNK